MSDTNATFEKDPSLEKPITIKFLVLFALPTMIGMLGMGIFGIVDGIFAARYIDAYALSAVGLVMPFVMFSLSVGFMLGMGGNALVAKEVGEGRFKHARRDMTLISLASFIASVLLTALGWVFPDVVLNILGVDADVYHLAHEYFMVLLPFMPLAAIGIVLQQFMMTEGKAGISMLATIGSGLFGVYLNYLLIYQLHMGLRGAAIATGLAYAIPALTGTLFFIFNRRGNLYFVLPKFKWFVIKQSAINGVSEMFTMMSASISGILMNNVLMDLDGPMAVAAVGIASGAFGLVANTFIGFSSGIAPIISYNYGKGDTQALRKLFSQSVAINVVVALLSTVAMFAFTDFFIGLYDIDPVIYIGGFLMTLPAYTMAVDAIRILALGGVFMALNTFASIWFTSLNDGVRSGIIAFLKGFGFDIAFIFILSSWWGVTGVFLSTAVSQVASLIVAGFLLFRYRKVYNYA